MLLVSILNVTTCSIVISVGITVSILVVHWHSISIGVGACMVDAGGIVACCVVLVCVVLPVDGNINRFWLILVEGKKGGLVRNSFSQSGKDCLNLTLLFC